MMAVKRCHSKGSATLDALAVVNRYDREQLGSIKLDERDFVGGGHRRRTLTKLYRLRGKVASGKLLRARKDACFCTFPRGIRREKVHIGNVPPRLDLD